MLEKRTSVGVAALAICESLLIVLVDDNIISETRRIEFIEDALSALQDARENADLPGVYSEAEKIIKRMLAGCNGVRHD